MFESLFCDSQFEFYSLSGEALGDRSDWKKLNSPSNLVEVKGEVEEP